MALLRPVASLLWPASFLCLDLSLGVSFVVGFHVYYHYSHTTAVVLLPVELSTCITIMYDCLVPIKIHARGVLMADDFLGLSCLFTLYRAQPLWLSIGQNRNYT